MRSKRAMWGVSSVLMIGGISFIHFNEHINYMINALRKSPNEIIFENHIVRNVDSLRIKFCHVLDPNHVNCFCIKCQEELRGKMRAHSSIVESNYGECEHGTHLENIGSSTVNVDSETLFKKSYQFNNYIEELWISAVNTQRRWNLKYDDFEERVKMRKEYFSEGGKKYIRACLSISDGSSDQDFVKKRGVVYLFVGSKYAAGVTKGFKDNWGIGMNGEDDSSFVLRQVYCHKHLPEMVSDIQSLQSLM